MPTYFVILIKLILVVIAPDLKLESKPNDGAMRYSIVTEKSGLARLTFFIIHPGYLVSSGHNNQSSQKSLVIS